MGKASISIAISGSYNGSAVERAQKSLERLAVRTAAAEGSISKSWVEAGSRAAEAGGKMYNAGQAVAEAGDAMTAGVTVPLAAIGAASAKSAIDFESSMSRVSGALNDPKANMEELRQLALDMGADTVFSASEAGAAMEELAKGGLTAADIKGGALRTTMDLAAAGNLALADAANITVQTMGAFQLGAEQTGEAANALAGAAAASSADVSDLSMGLSQASAQANAAGWSIQDTTAALAAFADAGIVGSDAGTSLKTMLQRLSAPTDKAADMIEALGINTRDANGNMLDAASVAGELQAKLGGLDSATRDAAIQTIFGSDASRAALVMMNQGADGIERYTEATNDQAAAQRLADSQMGETERSIEEMNGAIETAAINVGTALAPSVTAAANAVGDAADSFSKMDEGTQQAVVGFGLVAAAAGPVLSVTGRITKGFGSFVTMMGKVKQDVGAYADALTTTNVASIKAYQGNEKLAKALAKNPAAKAAGGVQQYVDAVTEANVQTSRYNAAVRKLEAEQRKGSKANADLVSSLRNEVAGRKGAVAAANSTVESYKATAAAAKTSTAAVKAQSVAMKAAAVAASGLKLAMSAIAPVAIIAGITSLAGAFAKAREDEERFAAATEGLVAATMQGVDASSAGAASIEGYGASARAARADIDGMLASQAELAGSIRDTNTTASAQTAQLQQAYSTIQQYANHSDLSNEAQSRLGAAVKTVNDMCGTQIEVTDAANGALADENGAIQDVTGSLKGYVDQKVQQIKIDAQQENLTALYRQQIEDVETLTQAQIAYREQYGDMDALVQQHYDYMRAKGVPTTMEQARATVEANAASSVYAEDMRAAEAALTATNTAIENVSSSISAQASVTDEAASSIGGLALASPIVSAAMNEVGGDVEQFAADLSNAGVSVETFRGLSEVQLSQLVASWDGTGQSIVDALGEMKEGMHDDGLSAATALANGMSSGTVGVDVATEALKAAASGDWSGVAAAMHANGTSLPQSVSDAISDSSFMPSEATGEMLSAIALRLAGGDAVAAAEILGGDIDEGLARGIMEGSISDDQAALLGQEVIDKAKETLESHSPSLAFYRIGADVDEGLGLGISGNSSSPLTAIGELAAALVGTFLGAGVPGRMRAEGGRSSVGLAEGVKSGYGSVSSAASAIASKAASMKDVGDMYGPGSALSWAMRSGIYSNAGKVLSAAGKISSNAASMVWKGDTYRSGAHLSQNFANGIMAGIGWVSDAARKVAQAAKASLGFSVPSEGPWSGAERGGETSGMHLAQNFAAGMLKGTGNVSDAARKLASASYFEAGNGGFSSGIKTLGGYGQGGTYNDAELMAALSEVVNLLREIASKDANAYIGANEVSAALAQASKTTAKARGYAV